MLTLQNLQNQWVHAELHSPGLIEGMAASAEDVFSRYGITSDLVIAHLMAQMSVETGGGVSLLEDLAGYTAITLQRVFPTHFTTAAMAQQAAGNAMMVGEIAYGGRLGNAAAPSTDGYVFRGAGLIQLTGKGGRVVLQKMLVEKGASCDIVANPSSIVDAQYALECAAAYFASSGCIAFAEKDCADCVSYRVNGGTNGILQRRQQLLLWKRELGVAPLPTRGPCPPVPGAPPPAM